MTPEGQKRWDDAMAEAAKKAEPFLKAAPRLYNGGKGPTLPGFDVDRGWHPIVLELSRALERKIAQGARITCCQVKQKFATLRFYLDGEDQADAAVVGLIADAEEKCSKTCEKCGAPGSLRHTSWLHVACDRCEHPETKR